MSTLQQTLERAYAALNAAAFAHPSSSDSIGTQCSEAAEEIRALLAQPAVAHERKVLEDVEPFVFEEYPYNSHAMGCGLEDRDITDRYEAMAYGWERAMERAAEAIPDDLYPAATVAALKAERDAALARVAVLEKDAARYRWLRQEHERFDPICHLTWKAGGNRNSSEWVNTAVLDSSIDAALTPGETDEELQP